MLLPKSLGHCCLLYTHIHTYTHTHTYTHIHIHTHTHIHTHIYTYTYIHTYTHTQRYTDKRIQRLVFLKWLRSRWDYGSPHHHPWSMPSPSAGHCSCPQAEFLCDTQVTMKMVASYKVCFAKCRVGTVTFKSNKLLITY